MLLLILLLKVSQSILLSWPSLMLLLLLLVLFVSIQVEAKDPTSGTTYYYNESIGKSQWERPVEMSSITQMPSPLPLEDWVEAVDETNGIVHNENLFSSLSLSLSSLFLLYLS